MNGYITDIERDALANQDCSPGPPCRAEPQLVLMALRPAEGIGFETHDLAEQP